MMTSRRLRILAAALAALGPSVAAADGTGVHDVKIAVFQFQPAELRISPGETVRWANMDGIQHSATATATLSDGGPVFDTMFLGKGETREATFTQPGTYTYFCRRHPSMTGTIVVAAVGAAP